MPQTLVIEGENREVATEDELLDFVNRVREAGGVGVLEALLPSKPWDPEKCLVANALNFGCSVDGPYNGRWRMELPHNMSGAQQAAIAEAIGGEVIYLGDEYGGLYYINLPQEIGNAAWAFDRSLAFKGLIANSGDPYA